MHAQLLEDCLIQDIDSGLLRAQRKSDMAKKSNGEIEAALSVNVQTSEVNVQEGEWHFMIKQIYGNADLKRVQELKINCEG